MMTLSRSQPRLSHGLPFVLFALFSMLAGCSYDPNKLSRTIETKQAAEPLVQALKIYRKEHGAYPARIDDLKLPRSVADDIARYEIKYVMFNAGNAYALGFDPPGPAISCAYGEGVNDTPARWQCAMK